jgi:hypothetical protein
MHAVVQLCKCRSISFMIQICKIDYKYVSSFREDYICKILCSYSNVSEDSDLLGCDAWPLHVSWHFEGSYYIQNIGITCPLIQCHVVEGVNSQECVHNSEIPLHSVLHSPRDPRLVLASH